MCTVSFPFGSCAERQKGTDICRSVSLDINAGSEISSETFQLYYGYFIAEFDEFPNTALLTTLAGWLTVLGWQASIASGAFACAGLIQIFIQIVDPSYVPRLWHTTLLYYGCIGLALLATVPSGAALSRIESVFIIVYVCGFFAILIPVVWLAPHGDAHFVFRTFENGGDWQTQGLSFMIGLSGVAFDFLGQVDLCLPDHLIFLANSRLRC